MISVFHSKRHHGVLTLSQLNAHVDIELALSLVNLNLIYELANTRSILQLYPKQNHDSAAADPLLRSGIMMEHLPVDCTNPTVPTGVISFHENGFTSKVLTSTRRYTKSTPGHFGK